MMRSRKFCSLARILSIFVGERLISRNSPIVFWNTILEITREAILTKRNVLSLHPRAHAPFTTFPTWIREPCREGNGRITRILTLPHPPVEASCCLCKSIHLTVLSILIEVSMFRRTQPNGHAGIGVFQCGHIGPLILPTRNHPPSISVTLLSILFRMHQGRQYRRHTRSLMI